MEGKTFEEARIDLYRERIKLLQDRLLLRDTQIEILKWDIERLKEILNRPIHARSQEPLYLSEPEEDAIEMARIEAEDLLRQLDFDNSEIEFDNPQVDNSLF